MTSVLIGHSQGAYDLAGTAIRLPYDPPIGNNLLDDPTVEHELTHYGQNIMTGLGIEQTLRFHELYAATAEILANDPRPLTLPLSRHAVAGTEEGYWGWALFALWFEERVIGRPVWEDLAHFEERVETIRQTLLPNVYTPGSDNPFYFQPRRPNPGFGIMLNDGTRIFFRLDGHFIQETHARASEFFGRWAQESLSIDDSVTYFLFTLNNPYVLLYLAVSKYMTERLGEGIFTVEHSILVCHLCAQIALNAFGAVPTPYNRMQRQTDVHWTHPDFAGGMFLTEFDHFPGEIFLNALGAALDHVEKLEVSPGGYFELMAATLTELGYPQFERIMTRIVEDVLEGQIQWYARSPTSNYDTYLLRKLESSKSAISWIVDKYEQRNMVDFIRAPLHTVVESIVPGPVICTPSSYSIFNNVTAKLLATGPSPEQMRGLLTAFITQKLWHSNRLTCLEPNGSPLQGGSVISCNQEGCRRTNAEVSSFAPPCSNALWSQVLQSYPGLSERVS